MTKKKVIKYLQVVAVLVIYLVVTAVAGIGCPIRRVIHMPCPSCGITRGVVELVKFNLDKAFEYHPLVIFLPVYVLFLLSLTTDWIQKVPKWLRISITVIGAIIIFGVYIYRVINGFGPV